MRSPAARLLLIAVVAAAGVGAWAGPAGAKSFRFSRVEISAEVRPDGSMRVVERRTYVFDGSFRFATRDVALRGAGDIREIGVADEQGPYRLAGGEQPGTFQVRRSPGQVEIKWFYRARDEARTFVISYLLTDVVTVWRDVAEVYWKFVGAEWEVPSDDAVVSVRLPGQVRREEIRAWGHGPLHGVVTVEDGLVRLAVRGLPAFTMVEGRVLFPPRAVPQAAKRRDRAALEAIVAEESGFASRANRERAKARAFVAAWIAYPAAVLGLFLYLYLRFGREPEPRVPDEYYRELPGDYPPAEVGVLWRFRRVRPEDFVATVMDLARRGYLRIEEREAGDDDEYVLTPLRDATALQPYERRALELLFGRRERPLEVSRRGGITGEAKQRLQQGFAQWASLVTGAAARHGWFDARSSLLRTAVRAGGIVLAAGSFFAPFVFAVAAPRAAVLVLEGIPLGIVLSLFAFAIDRRSPKGADEFRRWRGFQRFLRDFSQMKDQPVPALTLWEHYLVYAIPLGVADRVLRQLRALYPAAELQKSGIMRWYSPSSGWGRGDGRLGPCVLHM